MEKIPYSDFEKVELRVGKILEAKEHPNATKLFILKVDLGEEERTIVSGLRGHYTSEELEGKEAVFATNLEPANLRGVESNGMILAAVTSDRSKIKILVPEKEIGPGTKIS